MESNNGIRHAAELNLKVIKDRRAVLERDEAATVRAAHNYGVSFNDIVTLTGLPRKLVRRVLAGGDA